MWSWADLTHPMTRRWPNDGSISAKPTERWANVEPSLGHNLMLALLNYVLGQEWRTKDIPLLHPLPLTVTPISMWRALMAVCWLKVHVGPRAWSHPLWKHYENTVEDGGPTLEQHWVNTSCLLGIATGQQTLTLLYNKWHQIRSLMYVHDYNPVYWM